MRELLGEKDNRRLALVEAIYMKPGISMDELSKNFYLTPMQIQLDVAFLNPTLAPLKIEIKKDKTCFLDIPPDLSIKVLYQVFLAENIAFKLLEAILFREYDQYEQLANELFVSQATLKRTIRFINRCFEPHDVQIKSRPIRIIGNEGNIRAFYLLYLQERYPDGQYPFSPAVKIFSEELVAIFLKKFSAEQYCYSSIRRRENYAALALVREIKQHTDIKSDLPSDLQALVQEEINQFMIKDKFEYIFQMKLTPHLYQRIFFQYLNQWHAFSIRDYQERVAKNTQNREIYDGLKDTIISLSQTFQIPTYAIDEWLLKIYNVISIGEQISITPYIIFPNRKAFLLSNEVLRKTVLDAAKKLFIQHVPRVAKRNEAYFYEFFYLLVTHWPGFYDRVKEQISPCKVGMFFNSDVEHMYFMKQQLEGIFVEKLQIEVLDFHNLEQLLASTANYDFLIINFILPKKIELPIEYISIVDSLWRDKLIQIEQLANKKYFEKMRIQNASNQSF